MKKSIFKIYDWKEIYHLYQKGCLFSEDKMGKRLDEIGEPRVLILERFPGAHEYMPRVFYEHLPIIPDPLTNFDRRPSEIRYTLDYLLLTAIERGISGVIYNEVSREGAILAINAGNKIACELKNVTDLDNRKINIGNKIELDKLEKRGKRIYHRLVKKVNSILLEKE